MLGFMQSAIAYIIAFPLVILVVVTVHELGHFWAAKACKVEIEKFSIGFGRAIVSWRDRDGVQWQIGWLPLGGYVRFAGDENAASVPDQQDLASLRTAIERREGQAAVSRYLHFKPLWQRAFIVVAGPLANFVLAIVLFAALLGVFGETVRRPVISGVNAGSPAAAAGFRQGDVILSADGRTVKNFGELETYALLRSDVPIRFKIERDKQTLELVATPALVEVSDGFGGSQKAGELGFGAPPLIANVEPGSAADKAGLRRGDLVQKADGAAIGSFEDLTQHVARSGGRPIAFDVYRDGATIQVLATPRLQTRPDAAGKPSTRLLLGVAGGLPASDVQRVRYNPVEALAGGVARTWDVLETTVYYLGRVIRLEVSAEQISGPIGIAKTSGQLAQAGAAGAADFPSMLLGSAVALIWLSAILSVSVGFMNLLPIPVLDGGHLLFYAYEAIARRPLGARLQAAGYRVGLALLLSFMLFATWNDLQRLSVFKFFGGLFS